MLQINSMYRNYSISNFYDLKNNPREDVKMLKVQYRLFLQIEVSLRLRNLVNCIFEPDRSSFFLFILY